LTDLKTIMSRFISNASYESTLSDCNVIKTERKKTYVLQIKHKQSRLAYGYDSDMYQNKKNREILIAKDNFENELREYNYDYKMLDKNTYKVKKEKNEKFK